MRRPADAKRRHLAGGGNRHNARQAALASEEAVDGSHRLAVMRWAALCIAGRVFPRPDCPSTGAVSRPTHSRDRALRRRRSGRYDHAASRSENGARDSVRSSSSIETGSNRRHRHAFEVARAQADGYTILVGAAAISSSTSPDENAVSIRWRVDAGREGSGRADRVLYNLSVPARNLGEFVGTRERTRGN